MDEAKIELPGSEQLRQMLRNTTEHLCHELAMPRNVAPDWLPLQWRVAMAAAAMHGIAGLLARRLRWQGPTIWESFLEEQRLQTSLRDQRARLMLCALDRAARQAGLPLLAMKGSALMSMGLYETDERPMSDIDLLARPSHMDEAQALAEAMGYVPNELSPRHRQLQPAGTALRREFGEHMHNPLKIELHDHVAELLPRRPVDLTDELSTGLLSAGLNPYPDQAALMRHLLLHAAGNFCQHSVRLIHLHDIALLSLSLAPSQWQRVLGRPGPAADGWVYPPLALAERCLPGRVPAEVLQAAARNCPPVLRWHADRWTLSDVSMTGLRMTALPGLAWCDGPGEFLKLLARRIQPDRATRRLAQQQATTHAPLIEWPGLRRPRWRRALDWLGGRPPRAHTLFMVKQALHYRPSASSSYSLNTQEAV